LKKILSLKPEETSNFTMSVEVVYMFNRNGPALAKTAKMQKKIAMTL